MSVQRTRLALILYDYPFEERRDRFTKRFLRFVRLKFVQSAFFWKFFSSWYTFRNFSLRFDLSIYRMLITRTDDHRMIRDHYAINNDTFFIYQALRAFSHNAFFTHHRGLKNSPPTKKDHKNVNFVQVRRSSSISLPYFIFIKYFHHWFPEILITLVR